MDKLKQFGQLLIRHKKKVVFVAFVLALVKLAKKGYLGRFLMWLMARAQQKMLSQAMEQTEKTKVQLEAIERTNKLLAEYLENGYKESTKQFAGHLNQKFGNEQFFDSLKNSNLKSDEKIEIWNAIGKNVAQKILYLLAVKPISDFASFVKLVLHQKMQVADPSYSIYTSGAPQGTFALFVNDYLKVVIERWAKALSALEGDNPRALDWKIGLTTSVAYEELMSTIRVMSEHVFADYCKVQLPDDRSRALFDPNVGLSRVLAMKQPEGFWNRLFISKPIEKSLFKALFDQLGGYVVECPSDLITRGETSIQLFLDIMASDYAFRFMDLAREHTMQKLANRLLMFYKKTFSEDAIFDTDSKIVLAKIFSNLEAIFDEEFLSPDCLELDRQMLMQKLKLSIYIRKHYEKTTQSNQPENAASAPENHLPVAEHESGLKAGYEIEDKDLALNQSFIGRINLESPNTAYSTGLFLKELLNFESLGHCLKNFASQLK